MAGGAPSRSIRQHSPAQVSSYGSLVCTWVLNWELIARDKTRYYGAFSSGAQRDGGFLAEEGMADPERIRGVS